jgi:hypothetical protein
MGQEQRSVKAVIGFWIEVVTLLGAAAFCAVLPNDWLDPDWTVRVALLMFAAMALGCILCGTTMMKLRGSTERGRGYRLAVAGVIIPVAVAAALSVLVVVLVVQALVRR